MRLSEIRKLKKAAAAVLAAGLCILTVSGGVESQPPEAMSVGVDKTILCQQHERWGGRGGGAPP
ncbi:MAG: hypothetical protein K2H31_03955, partial [Lachnospiraceae bacterium]|nr:hypothetical protein [Lachnospiraceae bacterium]